MNDVDPAESPTGGSVDRRRLRWRPRALRTASDRHRILAALYPMADDVAHWWFRFAVMLTLSIVVAVMGLSLNSGAIVIGAMLIAPLMTPVLGVSAALVMAWPRRLGHSAVAVLAGSVGAVGAAWVLTSLLPVADRALTPEVLSRTNPDLRDLLVALAAGAAGAYATVREDVSAALPGVAVAVALVPPLAAIGFTLAAGRADLAGGALLLYLANLAAIILAGAFVLLASSFVPEGRLRNATTKIRLGLLAVLIATVAVAVPLTIASISNASQAQATQAINQAVANWIKPDPVLTVSAVNIEGTKIKVDVIGPVAPPDSDGLIQAITAILGTTPIVQVQWIQSSRANASQHKEPTTLTHAQLHALVQTWLTNGSQRDSAMRVLSITINGDSVNVELEGPSAPPPASTLARAISKQAGRPMTVSVSWSVGSFTTTTTTTRFSKINSSSARSPTEAVLETPDRVEVSPLSRDAQGVADAS